MIAEGLLLFGGEGGGSGRRAKRDSLPRSEWGVWGTRRSVPQVNGRRLGWGVDDNGSRDRAQVQGVWQGVREETGGGLRGVLGRPRAHLRPRRHPPHLHP